MKLLDRIILEEANKYFYPDMRPNGDHYLSFSHALLARLEQEGWKVVPTEPSENMVHQAAWHKATTIKDQTSWVSVEAIYSAILSAAPRLEDAE